MAVRPMTTASSVALELGGKLAGFVTRLQPPGYTVQQVATPTGRDKAAREDANVGFSAMEATFDLADAGSLLDWALSLPRGKLEPQSGAALMLDQNFTVRRRIDWAEGYISEIKLPTLDAASKLPFTLDLKWQPGTVSYADAGGERVNRLPGKRKRILTCNFRVLGLPFDNAFVTRVVLPTVTARDLGEVRIEVATRSLEGALDWVRKVIADGRLTDEEYLDFDIELCDATLKSALATVSLVHCGLLRYEEDPIEGGREQAPRVALTFSVGGIDLRIGKA